MKESFNTKGLTNALTLYETEDDNNADPMGKLTRSISEYYNLRSQTYHKKQAFLATYGLVSAHLDENMTLILSEQQDVNGLSFINAVGEIIPDKFKSEFSELSKQIFIHNPGALKNKSVLALNPAVVKKNSPILKVLIECGHVKDQALGKANGATSINKIRIEGPTSIVVLVGKVEPRWLNEFPALRLVLDTNPNFVAEQLSMRRSQANPLQETLLQKIIVKELERLKPVPVNISFLGQIIDSLDQNNPKSITIIDTIISLLNIITIINSAVFATRQEAQVGYYGLEIDAIKDPEYLIEQKTKSAPVEIKALEATKVEYYILYLLFDGVFNPNEDQVNGNSRLIFDAAMTINGEYIFNSTTLKADTATEVEFIKALDNQKEGRGWASVLQIKEKIKNDTGNELSDSSIHRGIKELCERKFLAQKKDPKVSNKNLYAVATLSLDSEFALPKPSTIIDPVYNGTPVKVKNILTGEKEII